MYVSWRIQNKIVVIITVINIHAPLPGGKGGLHLLKSCTVLPTLSAACKAGKYVSITVTNPYL
jgi:hypothetical protein